MANIKPNKLFLDNVEYIDKIYNKINITKGDILLTRKGTYGISYFVDKNPDFSISSEIFCLRTKNINNRYLNIFFNSKIGQTIFYRIKTGAIMGHITQEVIKDIKIPILTNNKQEKIIQIMDNAYQLKDKKEYEVKTLLDNIDDYLLKKFNIKFSYIEHTKTQVISCNDLLYNRVDPYYYQQEFQDIYSSIQKINHCEIGDIAFVQGGKRIPKDKNFSHEATSFKYFRVTDINSKKNIDDLKSIDEDLFYFLEQYEVKDKNIILSNAGTIGKIQLFKNTSKNRVILTENAVKIIVKDDSINNEYLSIVLNSSLLQKQMEREFIQTTIPKLSIDRIKKLLIPLPEKVDEQKIIVEHITKIKNEAQQLREEAILTLEIAKKEVEKIILGEE